MFLRKGGTSWSGDLLRHELVYSGIRHCRTRLEREMVRTVKAVDEARDDMAPPPGRPVQENGQLNG